MNFTSKLTMIFFFCLIASFNIAFAGEDIEGSKDNPYLSRMPNYQITDSEEKEFEAFQFCDGKALKTVEGTGTPRYITKSMRMPRSQAIFRLAGITQTQSRNIGGRSYMKALLGNPIVRPEIFAGQDVW